MTSYRNTDRDSGVAAYELGIGHIDVQFKDRSVYRYTNASAGAANIDTMKRFAASGNGLNAFINQRVRTSYAARLR